MLSFNIDTNAARMEEGYARDAFPEWRANERAPYLVNTIGNIIRSNRPDIIEIQEGRKFITKFGDEVDSISKIVEYLKGEGYVTLVQSYNETGDKAFKFITAFNADTWALDESYIRYLTKTPNKPTDHPSTANMDSEESKRILSKIKDHNYGVEWEWGVFIVGLKNRITGQKIYSFNIHLNPQTECRMKSSALIIEFVEEIINKDPNAKIVIAGDFNAISNWGGAEQLEIINQAKHEGEPLLSEATKDLKLLDGSEVDFSFIAFPYDFAANERRLDLTQTLAKLPALERREKIIEVFYKECQALGSKTDRVYSRGLDESEAVLIPALTTEQTPKSYIEDDVRGFIVNFTRERSKPAFASDHQPILATFRYK